MDFHWNIFFNSILIGLSAYDQSIRIFLESLIVSSERTDYIDGLRYKGLSGGGGSTLSLSIGLAFSLTIWIAIKRKISYFLLILFLILLLIGIFFLEEQAL